MFARSAPPSNASPLTHHRPFAEQRLDHGQPVVPRHVLGEVDAFEVGLSGRHMGIVPDPESRVQELFFDPAAF